MKYSESVRLSIIVGVVFALFEIIDSFLFQQGIKPITTHFGSWCHDLYYAVCGIFMATWWSRRS